MLAPFNDADAFVDFKKGPCFRGVVQTVGHFSKSSFSVCAFAVDQLCAPDFFDERENRRAFDHAFEAGAHDVVFKADAEFFVALVVVVSVHLLEKIQSAFIKLQPSAEFFKKGVVQSVKGQTKQGEIVSTLFKISRLQHPVSVSGKLSGKRARKSSLKYLVAVWQTNGIYTAEVPDLSGVVTETDNFAAPECFRTSGDFFRISGSLTVSIAGR